MSHTHLVAAVAVCVAGLAPALQAENLSQYRDFALGSTVAAVVTRAEAAPAAVKVLHERPAMLQELEWRPSRWTAGSAEPSTDPVDSVLFSFYNDQLYRLVVDYSPERTLGMTATDLTLALSKQYGTALPRASWRANRSASPIESNSGTAVARWEDSTHMVVLYSLSSYRTAFRLVMTDLGLDGAAVKAEAQAMKLDAQEAPARDLARQKKDADEGRAAEEKARAANTGTFRP